MSRLLDHLGMLAGLNGGLLLLGLSLRLAEDSEFEFLGASLGFVGIFVILFFVTGLVALFSEYADDS